MDLSDTQLAAVLHAKKILTDAGLLHVEADDTTRNEDLQNVSQVISELLEGLPGLPSPAVRSYRYVPAAASPFSAEEMNQNIHIINRQTRIHALVDHPIEAIVEYPETGALPGQGVAHRFAVDPDNVYHPKLNVQYSLGDIKGGQANVFCGALLQSNKPGASRVSCRKETISCKLSLAFRQCHDTTLT